VQKVDYAIKSTILILLIVIASSCKTIRINKNRDFTKLDISERIVSKSKNAYRPEYMLINNGILRIRDENNTVVRTRIFIKKDEFIFVSARYLGFELFRFMIGNDSVKYINRFQRSYYFGKNSEIAKGITESLDITEIQELIYSGLYGINDSFKRNSTNGYRREDNRVVKETILDEGVKMQFEYDSDINLNKFTILDHRSAFYIDIGIERNSGELKEIDGTIYLNDNEIEWTLDIKEIEYKAFDKIDFRIGKDYYELPKFL
jgi:hypothetical protein